MGAIESISPSYPSRSLIIFSKTDLDVTVKNLVEEALGREKKVLSLFPLFTCTAILLLQRCCFYPIEILKGPLAERPNSVREKDQIKCRTVLTRIHFFARCYLANYSFFNVFLLRTLGNCSNQMTTSKRLRTLMPVKRATRPPLGENKLKTKACIFPYLAHPSLPARARTPSLARW